MTTMMTTTMITEMNINLKIRSIDFNKDEIVEKVTGRKKIINERVQYTYSNQYGETVLTCFKGKMKMLRTGETTLNIYFLEDGRGKFYMEAYGLKNSLEVKEGRIQYIDDSKIIISYKLFNGDELINSLVIELVEE